MTKHASLLALLAGTGFAFLSGCTLGTAPRGSGADDGSSAGDETVDESAVAGANQNDRSASRDGEELLTGAMVVSPSGRFIVMQRNTVTLVYDVTTSTYRELATPFARVAFAKTADVVFAFSSDGTLAAIDLPSLTTRWSAPLAASSTLLRLSDDGATLLFGDGQSVRVVDAATDAVKSTIDAPQAQYAAFVPGARRALVVGHTVWRDEGPHTPVYDVDLDGARASATLDVPNCEAPIVATPNGARAFLSPTYCSPGAQATPGETWTNPDPVSVIDLAASGSSFEKNLPGFGPVVLSKDGARLVAYLDVKRMDPAMFADPKQVPWTDGQRYYLMTIDPASLAFQLAPIGNAIPRFAMTADGQGLLVDASQKFTSRTISVAARGTVSIGADGVQGSVETNLDVFGSASAFGYFDLRTQSYAAFSGPNAPLDRFVQLADGRVLTLARRADGLGGVPYLIDVRARATFAVQGSFGSGVRDVGLSADGLSAFVRLRLPADVHDGGFYSREGMCVSADGSCGISLTATYEASVPFALVPPTPAPSPVDECPGGHDCF